MLNDLPEFVQKQILSYLASNNFSAAKSLYDAWESSATTHHSAPKPTTDSEMPFLFKQQKKLLQEIFS